MPIAHINIGSNLGDSAALVARAADMIAERTGAAVSRAAVTVSEPWGFSSPNRFVNLGIALSTDLAPDELLALLQSVERDISPASHRLADGSYADRLIDIDLIALGSAVVSTPALTLPHPRMHLRPFVLQPMTELEPGWIHPLLGLTPGRMLARLSEG